MRPPEDHCRYNLTIRNGNPPSAAFLFLTNLLHLHSARKTAMGSVEDAMGSSPQSSRTLHAISTQLTKHGALKCPQGLKPDSFLVLTAQLKPTPDTCSA